MKQGMKLLDIMLNRGTEAQEQAQLKRKVRRVQLQAETDLLETQSKIAELEGKVDKLLLEDEPSLTKVVELEMEIDSYKEGEKRMKKKIGEWF